MHVVFEVEFYKFHDPGLPPYIPGYHLFRMLETFRLDHCPAGVVVILAAPLERVQVSRCVQILDDLGALFCEMR